MVLGANESPRFIQYWSSGVVGRRWRNLSFLRLLLPLIIFVAFLPSLDEDRSCTLLLSVRFLISFWFAWAMKSTKLSSRRRWFSFRSNKSLSWFDVVRGVSLGLIWMWADDGRKIVLTREFGERFAGRLSFIRTARKYLIKDRDDIVRFTYPNHS